MKTTFLSFFAAAVAVSTTDKPMTPSTAYETSVYTITSCAPEATDCPAKMGQATNEVISYTTICPVTEGPASTGAPAQSTVYETEELTITSCPPEVTDCPASKTKTHPAPSTTTAPEGPMTTSTIYETSKYTITSCPPEVPNCPVGSKTSTVIEKTTICPVTETEKPTGPAETGKPTIQTSIPVESSQAPSAETIKAIETTPAPVLSTQTISTCIPTYTTSVITVYPSPSKPAGVSTTTKEPYGTAVPSGYPTPPKNNGTIPFTGAASTQRAGGLFVAVAALAVALL